MIMHGLVTRPPTHL